jgi:hypothetical protein
MYSQLGSPSCAQLVYVRSYNYIVEPSIYPRIIIDDDLITAQRPDLYYSVLDR